MQASKKTIAIIVASLVVVIFLGLTFFTPLIIGPYMTELTEDVESDETAFLVPAEEGSEGGGKAIGTAEDYEKHVRTQRMIIPQRAQRFGVFPGQYRYVPMMRVLRVKRNQVTREWTKSHTTGTSAKDESIKVESKGSNNFNVGVTIGCTIERTDASKYLFYWGSRTLENVVDKEIRGDCQGILAREFGDMTVAECPPGKNKAFKICYDEVREKYKKLGITVRNIGSSGGLDWENKEIQKQFDRQFLAENEVKIAQQEKLAQDEKNAIILSKRKGEADAELQAAKQMLLAQEQRNLVLISKAKAEREVAEEMEKAKVGLRTKAEIEAMTKQADAMLEMAKNWKGTYPTYLPANSTLLIGMEQMMPRPVVQPADKK